MSFCEQARRGNPLGERESGSIQEKGLGGVGPDHTTQSALAFGLIGEAAAFVATAPCRARSLLAITMLFAKSSPYDEAYPGSESNSMVRM